MIIGVDEACRAAGDLGDRRRAPGDETELRLVVNAPRQAGDYLLEIDMLQEGVSWFGPKGSKTLRVPVKVE